MKWRDDEEKNSEIRFEHGLEKSGTFRDRVGDCIHVIDVCLRIAVAVAGSVIILGIGLGHEFLDWLDMRKKN